MNEVCNEEALEYYAPDSDASGPGLAKTLLLTVEVVVVIALFAGALKLWQLRQDLNRELDAAQQVEAALGAAEQPVASQDGLAQADSEMLRACGLLGDGATPREACRLEIPALDLDVALAPPSSSAGASPATASGSNTAPVLVIAAPAFAKLREAPDLLRGQTIHIKGASGAVLFTVEDVRLVDAQPGDAPASDYVALASPTGQQIIILAE